MKVTFIRGTGLGGVNNDAFPGDVRDLPEAQAKQLIAAGRAVAGGEIKKQSSKKPEQSPARADDGNNGDA